MEHYGEWADNDDERPQDYVTGAVASETNIPVRPKSIMVGARPQSVVLFSVESDRAILSPNGDIGMSETKRSDAAAGGRPRSQFFPDLELGVSKSHEAIDMRSSTGNLVAPLKVFKKESVVKYWILTMSLLIIALALIGLGGFCFAEGQNMMNGGFCAPLLNGGSVALVVVGGFVLLFGMVTARNIANPPTYVAESGATRK